MKRPFTLMLLMEEEYSDDYYLEPAMIDLDQVSITYRCSEGSCFFLKNGASFVTDTPFKIFKNQVKDNSIRAEG